MTAPQTHPHDGYAYSGCKCVCCTNVRALATPAAGVHLGDEGLREALERLPRVRLTGEQLDRLDPDPEKHAWVDWDEYEEFVSLADVRAALAAQENPA